MSVEGQEIPLWEVENPNVKWLEFQRTRLFYGRFQWRIKRFLYKYHSLCGTTQWSQFKGYDEG